MYNMVQIQVHWIDNCTAIVLPGIVIHYWRYIHAQAAYRHAAVTPPQMHSRKTRPFGVSPHFSTRELFFVFHLSFIPSKRCSLGMLPYRPSALVTSAPDL